NEPIGGITEVLPESNRRIRLLRLNANSPSTSRLWFFFNEEILAVTRTIGPLACQSLMDQGNPTKLLQAVFYFVLLLPQFGSTSVNTRDFAPKVRIAYNHRIDSCFRETQ